jgi:hypothetical protein
VGALVHVETDADGVLLRSHGFLVDAVEDEEVGVVEDVVVDAEGHPTALVVSCGWFGRRRETVSVDDVAVIYPRLRRMRVRRRSARADGAARRR